MYSDILPPLGWSRERLEIKYPTISVKDLTNPVFNISTSTVVNDYIAEQIRKTQDEMMGKIVLSGDYIQPYAVIKLTNEKETKKMEAKKCDRCGKLYEIKDDKNDIDVCYKYSNPFFTGEAARYSEEYIKEKMSKLTFVKTRDGDVDLCPDCRESFKRWFENG